MGIKRHIEDSALFRPLFYRAFSSDAVARNPAYRALYRWRISRQQAGMARHPRTVAIEGTNRCNAACAMCGHRTMARPQGTMDPALYESLIGQLDAQRLDRLLLSGFGEPLLDPGLARKVALAKRRGIRRVGIVTNASLLDVPAARELAGAGLDQVHVSLDGACAATYGALRPGLDFDAVARNIDGLLSLERRPEVFIQVVLLEANRGDVRAIRRRWGNRADRLVLRQAQDWAGRVDMPAAQYTPHLKARNSWPPCHYLWDQLKVYWDGTVPACCLDYDALQVLGNAGTAKIDAIWNGGELAAMRMKHNDGRRGELPLCRQCRYFSVWW